MRRFISLLLVFLVVLAATLAVAQELNSSTLEVNGVVRSVSPAELRVSAKLASNRYFLYIFKLTEKTRIIGYLRKGAFVRVRYSQKRKGKAIIVTAQEVQVL